MNTDAIRSWFNSLLVNQELLFIAFVVITTMLLVLTVGSVLIGVRSPMKRKLAELSGEKADVTPNPNVFSTLESLAPIMSPKSDKERQSTRAKLMHAGFHRGNALSLFYSLKSVTTIVGLVAASIIYLSIPDSKYLVLSMVFAVGLGLFLPDIVLARMVKNRQKNIRAGIPDALDLLVVCTESGLGFNASLRRVADELVISHPELADELDTVCVKIKAGVTMPDALRELVVRTGLEELMGLVSMLSHASRIGGSLVNSLREYTEDYRDKRQQAAEEIAAKIPVKMMFPMVLFIWPCFFIVAIGPALISLSEAFAK
ncbi:MULTISPECIES: type II secretion system F family protein [unclassified Vibrio]|uniref:type II secretion system F family protein n=1 Tax=unclassified Vibrio TaxID=2614977 RepID=UPI001361DD7C|nr:MULTISPECIES: type II secretion system F family protein [unclassified Vibrio]NAW59261.1 type II secretion system F family protein [Vibrio sp. V36_P2S2PM302]NAX20000.1 type II secretion system F family protein [Vibrio sp. V39_P1S14PM300]NAX27508.1 type II secretion system F family protein [Vibrio sp. V38_P2S17PM301]NAX30668.1 type II secretion system F family protein [Vibrio sp. V37_P2S8PM304]